MSSKCVQYRIQKFVRGGPDDSQNLRCGMAAIFFWLVLTGVGGWVGWMRYWCLQLFLFSFLFHFYRNIALVVGAYTICTGPFCVGVFINTVYKDLYVQLQLLRLVTTLLAIMNSAINPIMYGLRMKSFKSAYLYLLRCKTSSAVEDSVTGTQLNWINY